jgi:transcriptional regulator GlxA family with amidase domain
MTARRVALVIYPGIQSLDLVGPFEVFQGANAAQRLRGAAAEYRVQIFAQAAAPIQTESGLSLMADSDLSQLRGPLDTLIVAGGRGVRDALKDRALLQAVKRAARRARRVVSVCSGAFVLAELGLLDGCKVTTHWQRCSQLARRYPKLQVQTEPIFVRDGSVYTSAGVSAGIDLALALVEEDLGRQVALEIARGLVLFLRRPGNQAQFSAQLAMQQADRAPLREVQRWIVEHPHEDLSSEVLARRAIMSLRHFTRCFTSEVGVTPARYVENVRVEAARRRLVESQDGLERVASQCGFGSSESLRRVFLRRLAVTPSEYRNRFRSAH